MNIMQVSKKIITFIQKHAGAKPAVLGLSGGIDSAVVAFLAVKALGHDRVFALMTPSATNTNEDLEYAKMVAKKLEIGNMKLEIEPVVKEFINLAANGRSAWRDNKKIIGNLKARIRMTLLYAKANEIGGIVLGTGNKSELMTGYFTKYGDGGVDILPIGDLNKTQVRELAKYLGVPKQIMDRPPTAGLWHGQTDEGEMGITYEKLDKILEAIEKGKSLAKFEKKDVEKVRKMITMSDHKRRMPWICKINF